MQIAQLAGRVAPALLAALMLSGAAAPVAAQGHDDHDAHASAAPLTAQQNELVRTVRDATKQFLHVTSVDGPGDPYQLVFGCVSGGDFGAMGLHYLNGSILHDGEIDIYNPEILLFEPTKDGGIRLTGADYIVFASEYEHNHGKGAVPSLDGQLFHFFDSPNRFGLDPFYTLHVWAWKDNPKGTFTNWNPNVSCDAFNPPPDRKAALDIQSNAALAIAGR